MAIAQASNPLFFRMIALLARLQRWHFVSLSSQSRKKSSTSFK
jgi:hypothetical protein